MSIRTHPYELKHKVVEQFFEGVSAAELTRKYELKNPRRVYDWVEKAREGGFKALESRKGVHSKGKQKVEKDSLEEKYERLKLENEYLKKLLDLKRG